MSYKKFTLPLFILLLVFSFPTTLTATEEFAALPYGSQNPGQPVVPFTHPTDWIPSGFLEYNSTDFNVFSRTMHRRPVTVAFEKGVPLSLRQQRAIATYTFAVWERWWQVFGGFPWPSYTLVIRNVPILSPAGELGIGWEFDPTYLNEYWHYAEYIGHGVFHAWLGNCIEHASSHVDPANPEHWSLDGFTSYYGDRAGGVTVYRQWMQLHWQRYQAIIGTPYDVPILEMGRYAQETGDYAYDLNVYEKGALIAYMIDDRLTKKGRNLNSLMRSMYRDYCLTRQRYTTEDVLAALEAVSGQEWEDFFNSYIYGTEVLPLNGKFRYFPHL